MARIDAATGSTLAEFTECDTPASIAVGRAAVWVGNEGDGTVSHIDPATHQVVATIPIGKKRFLRLATGEGRVWVAACLDKVVKVLDPGTHQVTASIPAEGCWNVAVGGGLVRVPIGERTVMRIDPATLVANPTLFVQNGPAEIASGFDSMWVANVNAMTVSWFDPITREVTATSTTGLDHTANTIHGLAVGLDRVWLATTDGVQGFDPTTNSLEVTFHAAPEPWNAATAGGSLWVTTNAEGGILQLDPLTGELIRKVAWGVAPISISAGP